MGHGHLFALARMPKGQCRLQELLRRKAERSNRIGSTKPLSVHIPVTELEEPMVENVLRKADRVHDDTLAQESLFAEYGILD